MTLITSLEQAGEGSDELDHAMSMATGILLTGIKENGEWGVKKGRWTQSLDAALAMAERLNLNGPCELHRSGVKEWGFHFEGIDTAYSPTPALSVCIAILRVMEGRK